MSRGERLAEKKGEFKTHLAGSDIRLLLKRRQQL